MNKISDEEIRQDVLNELQWDSSLSGTDISATVKKGVVSLVGVARNFAVKLAAEDAAHRVRGVLDVANEIEVRPAGKSARSDREIAEAVRQALEWDAMIDDTKVHSTVAHGWVTLTGTVGFLREREDAERAVRHLSGIRGLSNAIEVIGPSVDAAEVRGAIEGALQRRAEHGAKHVRVDVEGHSVTLSGKVDSWLEKRAVLGTVEHMPGVRIVNDGIEVDAYSP